jgi:catechol 2,3-dioxygenase-like lactoylglutathione lyase family enzyme
MASGLPKDIVLGYDHVGIYVSDLERSIKWYSDTLGYKLLRKGHGHLLEVDGSNEFFDADMAMMQCGDHYLELYYNPKYAPYNYDHYKGELGTKHISYILPPEQYERFIDYIWEKGVKFTVGGSDKHHVKEPFEGRQIMRVYFLDPDGIPIEVIGRELRGKAFRDMKK